MRWPYTAYVRSDEGVAEQPRPVSFIGTVGEDCPDGGLDLNGTVFTTLTLDNVRIERLQSSPPPRRRPPRRATP